VRQAASAGLAQSEVHLHMPSAHVKPSRQFRCRVLAALALSALLSGCAQPVKWPSIGNPFAKAPQSVEPFSQADLPQPVQVPRGNQIAFEAVGRGEITYQCRANAWVFVAPLLTLSTRAGEGIIEYEGPPAKFSHKDGSLIIANAVAAAPSSAGNLPFQLFSANRANTLGAMMGITYVQRVANVGGVAPARPCALQNFNESTKVPFQADYIFYRSL
jgi:hypothetical protein